MAIYNLLKYKLDVNADFTYIFDTNIWLYLLSDLHENMEREIAAYSNLLAEIIEKEYKIFLPSTILSEFTNVLLRADYNSIKDNSKDNYSFKKNYVGSAEYLARTEEITELIGQILAIDNLVKIDDNFHKINIDLVNNNFKTIDWNDSYLIELAKINNSFIVTHDRDFDKIHSDDFNIIRLF